MIRELLVSLILHLVIITIKSPSTLFEDKSQVGVKGRDMKASLSRSISAINQLRLQIYFNIFSIFQDNPPSTKMYISLLIPLTLLASLAAATPMPVEKAVEAHSAVMGRNWSDEIDVKACYYQYEPGTVSPSPNNS